MSEKDFSTTVLQLKRFRSALEPLNRTVTHRLNLAKRRDLLPRSPRSQHSRRVPWVAGVRRDIYFWDSWDRKIRGEDDLRQFFAIAEQIGARLDQLQESPAESLLPGTVSEIIGTRTNLFLPDYWLFVVHYLGWTDRLPYECRLQWGEGCPFTDSTLTGSAVIDTPFGVTSRLPINIVQGSIDALTVLIDVLPFDEAHHDVDHSQKNLAAAADSSSKSEIGPCLFPGAIVSRRVDPPLTSAETLVERPETLLQERDALLSPRRVPEERRRKKRADRAGNIEALKIELMQHLRAAREHAQSAADFGREPTLLPRPSRKELADSLGITESAVSRCFNDPQATELNFLWKTAGDLQGIQQYLRR